MSDDEYGVDSEDESLMAALSQKEEETFGDFNSSDEAELMALDSGSAGMKRKRGSTIPTAAISVKKHEQEPSFPTSNSVATRILKNNFGLQSFRLKQELAISRLLAGGSAVVVFPTGGGKSLCYQVPALAFSELDKASGRNYDAGGVTVVVSPLIALMKDQVDALRRRGIHAACLDSTKSRAEYIEIVDSARAGTLKLLYCAPERLNNEGFVQMVKEIRGGIRMVAIDEAHCISEWGHAFRPDYLKVARFVKEINAERVVCLTATATLKVAKDVCEAFDVDESGLFRTATFRPSLHLIAKSVKTYKDKFPSLVEFLRSNPGPTIIYVTLQQQSEDLSRDLNRKGFVTRHFHAGMRVAEKTETQEAFMADDVPIIVATIAFGMGIDKANIRNVVHYSLPRSLEGYSQEIGRAGRDGKSSRCLLYLCHQDILQQESFARGDMPSEQSVRSLLAEIFHPKNAKLNVGDTLESKGFEQSRNYDIRPTTLSSIYAQLELKFQLLRATTPQYSSYQYVEGSQYSMVHSDPSFVARAIKRHAKKAVKYFTVDIDSICGEAGIGRADVVRKLQEWNDKDVIQMKASGVVQQYRVLQKLPASHKELNQIGDDLLSQMKDREGQDLQRVRDVVKLICGKACFARRLAAHFGDSLPGNKVECGNCQWCTTHSSPELQQEPPVVFNHSAFNRVLAACSLRDDPRFLAKLAFGISSPKVTALKLQYIMGCMSDHEFLVLLSAFENVCKS
ncbi:ATP-dependent DNA helicase-like protein recQ [Aulographum hederae CBS 113979]|uniref:DNA 3'-5' helicase n=1 Tax=Aulographum hederae CBS 113979 TaxID=1176131 RepID=A0A6G1GLM5_9PEZI|nr:ATP-dependent DNA helicase-like protein recQ [Aulographum hederae CBS 113979]